MTGLTKEAENSSFFFVQCCMTICPTLFTHAFWTEGKRIISGFGSGLEHEAWCVSGHDHEAAAISLQRRPPLSRAHRLTMPSSNNRFDLLKRTSHRRAELFRIGTMRELATFELGPGEKLRLMCYIRIWTMREVAAYGRRQSVRQQSRSHLFASALCFVDPLSKS
jgi:hypothetical protein